MAVSGTPVTLANIKEWLEIMYFIAGIVVSIVAVLGLSQLRLLRKQINLAQKDIDTTKKISRTNARRSSVEVAVSENRRFAECCIQSSVKIRKFCKRNSITYFDDIEFNSTDNGFELDLSKVNPETTKKLEDIEPIINELVNGLESYALFFVSGIADERLAFLSNGKQYVETCEMAFKVLAITEVDDDDLLPVKALYFKWKKMLKEKELKIKQKEIQDELKKHDEKYVAPIGT